MMPPAAFAANMNLIAATTMRVGAISGNTT